MILHWMTWIRGFLKMHSIDANLLFYAFNADAPEHKAARAFIETECLREDVILSEFVLCEFYVLLRNPTLLSQPLSSREAVDVIQTYRRHPLWKVAGMPAKSREIHDKLWKLVSQHTFARRRIFDARTALSLMALGVEAFATANTKDFQDLGFRRVWNPLENV